MAASFLKGLPVHHEQNFARFLGELHGQIQIYLPTKGTSQSQKIVTEHEEYVRDYLNQHSQDGNKDLNIASESLPITDEDGAPRSKRPRI